MLREEAKKCKPGNKRERLLMLAALYDGDRIGHVSKNFGRTYNTIKHWGKRFNEHAPHGLEDTGKSGRPSKLSEDQWAQICDIVQKGPDIEVDGRIRWRLQDIQGIIYGKFEMELSLPQISDNLKKRGFR